MSACSSSGSHLPRDAEGVTLAYMSGKWVNLERTDCTAAEAAAEILRLRLEHVQRLLPLAAHEFRRDPEHVHRLRVGCRRADAAWQAFRPLLRGKAKRLRKGLQKIRRAAGPGRDADVLLDRLKAETGPGQEYVVARLKRQRANAQQALLEIAKEVESGSLDRRLQRCLEGLKKKSSKGASTTFDTFAQAALRTVSQKMFRLAGLEHPTVSQLHELRIVGKRLRYSIELFHSAFPTALREDVYPLVEKIQARLGRLNDHATAQAMFQGWLGSLPSDERAAQLAERMVEEHAAIEQVREDFMEWWTTKRVARLESSLSLLIDGTSA